MHLWRVRHTWDRLGRRDPLWAVLTWPAKQGNKWTIEEFLVSGGVEDGPAIIARGYLRELVRVLAPGGALVFQLPERMSADSMQLFLSAPVEGNALKRRLPRP